MLKEVREGGYQLPVWQSNLGNPAWIPVSWKPVNRSYISFFHTRHLHLHILLLSSQNGPTEGPKERTPNVSSQRHVSPWKTLSTQCPISSQCLPAKSSVPPLVGARRGALSVCTLDPVGTASSRKRNGVEKKGEQQLIELSTGPHTSLAMSPKGQPMCR